MSERYTKLFSLSENLYAETSPVVIAAGALLKDNATGKVLAQLKFRNITGKTVKALRVRITPLDTVGAPLGEAVSHQYLDLSAERNDEFGQKAPITLPDVATRAFSASVTEAIFADNSHWSGTDASWEPLPAPAYLSSVLRDWELEKQYCLKFGENCRYSPMEHKDLWYCACGALNTKGESRCHKCNNALSALLSLDMDALKAAKDERLAAEVKKAEEEKAAAEEQAKKVTKIVGIIGIIVAVTAVVIAAVLVVTQVIIPANQYKAAEALFEAGEYDTAIEAFEALDDYKDSAARAKEAQDAQKEAENAAAYEEATALLESGDYDDAYNAFRKLRNYKDSSDMMNQCQYNIAIESIDEGNIIEAYETLLELDGYKDSAEKAASIYDEYVDEKLYNADVGNYVFFGTYEQDNDRTNGKEAIEWLVLEKTSNRLLVISRYCLDSQPYDTEIHSRSLSSVTWAECTLRTWLNEDFLNAAFSDAEQAMIPTVRVSADKNPTYGTLAGNPTYDQVFLLSITEANRYFSSDSTRGCEATAYADDTWWWLRTPSYSHDRAATVSSGGSIDGSYVTTANGIRPAMWIDLDT